MRDDIIKVSGVSAEQRERWRDAAGNGPLASWMRGAADAMATGTTVKVADINRLESALADVRRAINQTQVGNNCNQIATTLNVDIASGLRPDVAPHEAALIQLADDFAALKEQVSGALALVRSLRP